VAKVERPAINHDEGSTIAFSKTWARIFSVMLRRIIIVAHVEHDPQGGSAGSRFRSLAGVTIEHRSVTRIDRIDGPEWVMPGASNPSTFDPAEQLVEVTPLPGHLWRRSSRHLVPRGRRDMPHQTKVVAAVFALVIGLVDKRPDDVDAEPADASLFSRRVQIRRAESERIERRPIVDETNSEAACPPPERHGDDSAPRKRSLTVRYGVGEELVEDDQKPRPLVIRQTAFVRELVGKGVQPSELGMLTT
jgi:hypothetical protein